jgi:hypothetical protein
MRRGELWSLLNLEVRFSLIHVCSLYLFHSVPAAISASLRRRAHTAPSEESHSRVGMPGEAIFPAKITPRQHIPRRSLKHETRARSGRLPIASPGINLERDTKPQSSYRDLWSLLNFRVSLSLIHAVSAATTHAIAWEHPTPTTLLSIRTGESGVRVGLEQPKKKKKTFSPAEITPQLHSPRIAHNARPGASLLHRVPARMRGDYGLFSTSHS